MATKYPPNPFRTMKAHLCYEYVIKQFLLRLSVDERVYPNITGDGSAPFGRGRGYYGKRMSVDMRGNVMVLLSYKMIIAAWIGNSLVVNGDGAPSQDTGRHHRSLLSMISRLSGLRMVPAPEPAEPLWTDEWRTKEKEIGYEVMENMPEWRAHADKWHAEKARLQKGHVTWQKLAAHCAGCGSDITPHAVDAAGSIGHEVHESWCTGRKTLDKIRYSIIPFSVLGYTTEGTWRPTANNAGVRLDDVLVLHFTEDFRQSKTVRRVYKAPNRNALCFGQPVWRRVNGVLRSSWGTWENAMHCPYCKQHFGQSSEHAHTVEEEQHFLGETLFMDRSTQRLYVCGLDRNDNPARRKFFLARLPIQQPGEASVPRTVDMALDTLRPIGIPATSPRQGEWFFVPITQKEMLFPREPRESTALEVLDSIKDKMLDKQVPIVSADGHEQMANHGERARRAGRHVASRIQCIGDGVYVKGPIKDREHDTLYLQGWHRVVRNTADGAWSVDPTGPKVD